MRTLLLLPIIAVLAHAGGAAAQTPTRRVTVTPTVGFVAASPLFEHDPRFDRSLIDPNPEFGQYELRDFTRLSLDGVLTAGARVAVPVGGRWTVSADGAYGTTEFEFRRQVGAYRGEELLNGSQGSSTMEASLTTFALGVARHFAIPGISAEAEAGIGAALQHFRLERPECRTAPPSVGFPGFACEGTLLLEPPRWEKSYNVPGATGHLLLRRRITPRLGIEGRAAYTVGRANTESFYTDLLPELDRYEATKRTNVRTTQLSAGVSVGF